MADLDRSGEATTLSVKRWVAIKIPRPDRTASRNALLKEAQKVGHLDHPSIVDVYDVGQDGPYNFMFRS